MELNLRMNLWVGRSLDDGELDYASQFETSCYIIVYYPPVIQHSVAMENGPLKCTIYVFKMVSFHRNLKQITRGYHFLFLISQEA